MEKFIRSLSTIITTIIIYTVGAYAYLSFKGFAWQNGTFVLVPAAQASTIDMPAERNGIAFKLPENLALNVSQKKAAGNAGAPLVMFEFSSLGCTHCADFHLNILPKLEKDYIESGKLKLVFVNFPLDKKSMQAAMLSECVPAQYRQNYLNTVFEKQREWMLSFKSDKMLATIAAANGLSLTAAETCLTDDKLAEDIIANRQEGIEKLKMQGTPAFLITDGTNNEIIYGVPDFDELKSYLDARLNP